ncbi:immunoglobulin lambda-1 light chain-like isoform X1 [Hemicordylus capensis]|uniref:immunoglobulin lambda-1 light chain-like isoform X1 n=1 Tax=Hemicordylus capensis TaxID=884348 RepID=UPI00230312C0|nr:immunoglobulin lambda-1 light chain-like isoform X1 [Hemicordylus capensis]
MFWAPLLSLLAMWCTGSNSLLTLSQPPSASEPSGSTVKLSCLMSSETSISGKNTYWYQQKPGNAPRYLLYYYSDSDKHQGSGVPSRFSGSKETSSNSFHLTIAGALAEDEADYYCAAWDSNVYIFGGGTHLEVTTAGQPAVPPKVHLFPPSSEELTSKRKGTLVCLIDDFIPGAIDVTWLADGSPITSNVETTRPTKRNDKYVASSYLSLTAAEYEKKSEYTCKVTHDGKSYQKSVQREACSA